MRKIRPEIAVEEDLREVQSRRGAAARRARYNVAPAQEVLVIREAAGVREATFFKRRLVPRWAKDPAVGNKLINARSETVTEKPSFREAFARRRCLIPADGFYEWQRAGKEATLLLQNAREGPLRLRRAVGALGRGRRRGHINSCTILTSEANDVLRSAHDRMLVILRPEDHELWLEAEVGKSDLVKGLLRPYPSAEMLGYPVGALVNSQRNQGVELTEHVAVNSI